MLRNLMLRHATWLHRLGSRCYAYFASIQGRRMPSVSELCSMVMDTDRPVTLTFKYLIHWRRDSAVLVTVVSDSNMAFNKRL